MKWKRISGRSRLNEEPARLAWLVGGSLPSRLIAPIMRQLPYTTTCRRFLAQSSSQLWVPIAGCEQRGETDAAG